MRGPPEDGSEKVLFGARVGGGCPLRILVCKRNECHSYEKFLLESNAGRLQEFRRNMTVILPPFTRLFKKMDGELGSYRRMWSPAGRWGEE